MATHIHLPQTHPGPGWQLFHTSVGPRWVCFNYDVPDLGSSGTDRSIYLQRGWRQRAVARVIGREVDRTPFVVEHEAVEYDAEMAGRNYSFAHYDCAEPAEHKLLLMRLGLKRGNKLADQAIEEYEHSYGPDLRWAASIKNPVLPPNLYKRPYEHPHSAEQRKLAAEVGV